MGDRPTEPPCTAGGEDCGDPVVSALASAWADIRTTCPDIPHVAVLPKTDQNPEGDLFGVEFHRASGDRPDELWVTYEQFFLDGRFALHVLFHEAVHALAAARGVEERSPGRRRRYHNKQFVKLAEELGLEAPECRFGVHGWAVCHLPEATAARYTETIAALDAARAACHRVSVVVGDDDERKQRVTLNCDCEPPRYIRVTAALYFSDPILCDECGRWFMLSQGQRGSRSD